MRSCTAMQNVTQEIPLIHSTGRSVKMQHNPLLSPPQTYKFEVLTAVVMKSSLFWDITQCSPHMRQPNKFKLAHHKEEVLTNSVHPR
jgi:hypothetical protein